VTALERSPYDLAYEAAERIRERVPLTPKLAIVLGSGLGSALALDDAHEIPYAAIPHFPISTVPGHAGSLFLAEVEGLPVALLSGRAHLYEGYEAAQAVFGIRVMRLLGAETLLITNAAGGVNESFHAGTLMLISDHINLTGRNPLIGPNDDRLGPRFPDMSQAYDSQLLELARRASQVAGVDVTSGVYCALLGPSFETPAEIRMLRSLGADAVGMSTALEVIAANHMGMRVLGISCITNMAAGILPQRLSHAEVLETTNRVRDEFANLLRHIVAEISSSSPNSGRAHT
jgi:purine-nucleoside phosphorylase